MSYPDRSTWPITEWLIDGAWVDLSERQRAADGPIEITRGRQSEQGNVAPGQISYTMNNHDGELSNRNPLSAWYGKIPTGTRMRIRAGAGDVAGYMRYNDTFLPDDLTSLRTPDKAALDITGDIEVRMDIQPHAWRPGGKGRTMILASKHKSTGNQRSWVAYINYNGRVGFGIYPLGDTTVQFHSSTASIPAESGRLSIKITVDVDNGAGGRTVTFYTAPSIGGTYTMLGTPVTVAGTTSIFSGSAALVAGGGEETTAIFVDSIGYGGRYFGLQVFNGIGGTKVADLDTTTAAIEATSIVDVHGNVWSTAGQARITSPRVRFYGELTSGTQSADITGLDKTVPILGADIMQRLNNGRIAAQSPLFLNISQRTGLTGYWPLEDGEKSEYAASGLAGGRRGIAKQVTFGQDADLPGASASAELTQQGSNLRFTPKRPTATTGTWSTVFLFKMGNTLPTPALTTFVQINTTGSARFVGFQINTTNFGIRFFDYDFTAPIATSTPSFGSGVVVTGEWIAMHLKMTQVGGNVSWEWSWYQQGSSVIWGISGSYAGTVGYPTGMTTTSQGSSTLAGIKMSHFVLSQTDLGFGTDTWQQAINAYANERAVDRINRIARGAGIYCEITGTIDESVKLGAQPVDRPLNVMLDAAKADGGILSGLRDAYGLSYRTRQDMDKRVDVDLTYGTHLTEESPRVVDDSESIFNAITASRTGGSSAYAEITEGVNSVAEPPAGTGLRPGQVDGNFADDEILPDVAAYWARRLSYDQARVPNLVVGLHRAAAHPSTVAGGQLMSTDLGDTARVSSWPMRVGPDAKSFIVQGWRETLERFSWLIRFNVTQGGSYRTGTWNTPNQPGGRTQWGAKGSTLSAGVTSSATTLVIAGTATYQTIEVWTTNAARYPMDVMIGGEVIRLNNPPTGSTSPQTFNGVTRAVNGISKAHTAGRRMQLALPSYYGFKDGA